MDPSIITTANLTLCNNTSCNLIKDAHMLVSLNRVSLTTSKAVAISYAWGEITRRRIRIGHDDTGKIYAMSLGLEWDIGEVFHALVSICQENGRLHGAGHAAVWMDQLCLSSQFHNTMQERMDFIPSVYKALRTVALMPGGICGCLREIWENRKSTGVLDIASGCMNAVGVSSCMDRVWPREELLYSKAIRVVRTSNQEIPCVRSLEQAKHFSRYMRLVFGHYRDEGLSIEEAFNCVGERVLRFQSKLSATLHEYTILNHHVARTMSLDTAIISFLLGKTLTSLPNPDVFSSPSEGTDRVAAQVVISVE